MKTKIILACCFVIAFQIAKAQDYPKIASEYCNCLNTLDDSISADYIPLIIEASNAPQFSIAYFQALSPKGKDFSSNGMKSWSRLKSSIHNPDTEIGKCVAKVEHEYLQYLNGDDAKKKFYLALLSELELSGSCTLYVAVLKSLYRQPE